MTSQGQTFARVSYFRSESKVRENAPKSSDWTLNSLPLIRKLGVPGSPKLVASFPSACTTEAVWSLSMHGLNLAASSPRSAAYFFRLAFEYVPTFSPVHTAKSLS